MRTGARRRGPGRSRLASSDEAPLAFVRWLMLRLLSATGRVGMNDEGFLLMVGDLHSDIATAGGLRREVEYLAGLGMVEMGDELFGADWFARLTPAGCAVVEYRCAPPRGIARPPRAERRSRKS